MDNTFSKWLDAILAISGDNVQTVPQLAEKLGTSTRNVYYMIKAMKDYGFIIHRSHGFYNLDINSQFFKDISRTVNFTQEQANFLYNVLDDMDNNDAIAGLLKRKLRRFYHLDDYRGTSKKQKTEQQNLSLLQQAIYRKRMVVLHDYSSSNSQTISDRMVEPFMFLGNNTDVRAYELKSDCNKTFKISRIGKVEILKSAWENEGKHKKVFTDMFLFSSENWHHVKLRFDIMAYNYIIEEYPHSEGLMKQDDETHWIFETDLASYIGIGRFILGLYDDVEVIEDDGLRMYLDEKIASMSVNI